MCGDVRSHPQSGLSAVVAAAAERIRCVFSWTAWAFPVTEGAGDQLPAWRRGGEWFEGEGTAGSQRSSLGEEAGVRIPVPPGGT